MFCPECKAEYHPGFTHCVDCDVDLVEVLPAETRPDGRDAKNLKMVWAGTEQSTCIALCEALKAERILYEVWQGLKSRTGRGGVVFRYAVGVLPQDAERARALWSLPEQVVEENRDEDSKESEDKPVDPGVELPEGKYEPEDHHRADAYLKHWYPEEASVEVWTQPAKGDSYGLDMALKENYIRWRVETIDDGSRKFYVMPEDEARAREIVREVVEGAPPE